MNKPIGWEVLNKSNGKIRYIITNNYIPENNIMDYFLLSEFETVEDWFYLEDKFKHPVSLLGK